MSLVDDNLRDNSGFEVGDGTAFFEEEILPPLPPYLLHDDSDDDDDVVLSRRPVNDNGPYDFFGGNTDLYAAAAKNQQGRKTAAPYPHKSTTATSGERKAPVDAILPPMQTELPPVPKPLQSIIDSGVYVPQPVQMLDPALAYPSYAQEVALIKAQRQQNALNGGGRGGRRGGGRKQSQHQPNNNNNTNTHNVMNAMLPQLPVCLGPNSNNNKDNNGTHNNNNNVAVVGGDAALMMLLMQQQQQQNHMMMTMMMSLMQQQSKGNGTNNMMDPAQMMAMMGGGGVGMMMPPFAGYTMMQPQHPHDNFTPNNGQGHDENDDDDDNDDQALFGNHDSTMESKTVGEQPDMPPQKDDEDDVIVA
eukprot:PhM_4_TR2823/c0_g1_i2/m.33153